MQESFLAPKVLAKTVKSETKSIASAMKSLNRSKLLKNFPAVRMVALPKCILLVQRGKPLILIANAKKRNCLARN